MSQILCVGFKDQIIDIPYDQAWNVDQIFFTYIDYLPRGKSIFKGATQVSAHSLKLHFCMLEIYMSQQSQMKHNILHYHKFFGNIFH